MARSGPPTRPVGWAGDSSAHSNAAREGWRTRKRAAAMGKYGISGEQADFNAWYYGSFDPALMPGDKKGKPKSPGRVAAGQKAAQTRYGHAGKAPEAPGVSKYGGGVSGRGVRNAGRAAGRQQAPTYIPGDAATEVARASEKRSHTPRPEKYERGGGDVVLDTVRRQPLTAKKYGKPAAGSARSGASARRSAEKKARSVYERENDSESRTAIRSRRKPIDKLGPGIFKERRINREKGHDAIADFHRYMEPKG